MNRRALLAALASPAPGRGAAAQPAWPTKPVALVVSYPPGGGADLVARLVAPKMSEVLGQPVVVDNKPGAAGQIGAAYVAKARPDGYTVLVDASSFAINPGLSARWACRYSSTRRKRQPARPPMAGAARRSRPSWAWAMWPIKAATRPSVSRRP